MRESVNAIEQVTPSWLTAVLRREGVLTQGEVAAVYPQVNDAFNSTIDHLTLAYVGNVPATAPQRLLLKRNRPEPWARKAGAREVTFYEMTDSIRRHLPMIVRCYDAAYDPLTENSHLLLDDLTATHVPPVTRAQSIDGLSVPSREHLDGIVDAMARFHAYWWEHPLVESGALEIAADFRDQDGHEAFVRRTQGEWLSFVRTAVEPIPSDLKVLYENALAMLPQLWDRRISNRVSTRRNLTMIHNDCYLSQFLCPREPTHDSTFLIDFQGPEVSFATYDLVHLFATWWRPEQRHAENREERLLRRYHAELRNHGVTAYEWGDLITDYRLMLAYLIFYPIWDQTDGAVRGYWWPKLACLTGAYRDWNCAELLNG